MPHATFILSLDTEIAWGTYGDLNARAAAFDQFPALLGRLVNLLDIYEVPATWAVVGALVDGVGDVPEPHYSFAPTPDTARRAGHPAAWFQMPGLLDVIQGMRVPQEIGTHTYTHLLADDAGVSRGLFAAQMAAVAALHERHGLPPVRSLVFPQNRVAHLDVLAEYGIIAYRGGAQDWYRWLPRPLQRPAHLLDRTLGTPPPTYAHHDRVRAHGTVNLPASQFLMSYDGPRAHIPTAARVQQAERGLRRATQRGEIYHLWFHPFNLGSSEAMFAALTEILAHVWELRAAGRLRTVTMGDLAAEILAGQAAR